jgi:superfamily I DNA and/or RNA helicase
MFKELLALLQPQCDIRESFIITPFREVEKKLRSIMWSNYRDQFNMGSVGTVHTAQGQEADVVIFVLGAGANESKGTRRWASEKVNLANVAVSRAKHRLYVIGNHDTWSDCDYFKTIATLLPRVNAITDIR